MRCLAANPTPKLEGSKPLPGVTSYFLGQDRSRWRSGLKEFAAVQYRQVYPGIDLVYYGNGSSLEHDFIVGPGADANQIRFTWSGARSEAIDADGDLVFRTDAGEVRQSRPRLYQTIHGRRVTVEGSYRMVSNDGPAPEIGFHVGDYDHSQPLVIDPTLVYSTYLGGGDSDGGLAVTVDTTGAAYVTGFTGSADFPKTNGAFEGDTPLNDAFVTKLSKGGNAVVYSTYLGGSANDQGMGIAVNSRGEAYVIGLTFSGDFPTRAALQVPQGGGDAFVAKLSKGGTAVLYSTYLGGSGPEQPGGIVLDKNGNAFVTGATDSTDFPTVNQFQTDQAGTDVFVTKLFNAGGPTAAYSTYIGGNDTDRGVAIAVDEKGRAYVTGSTSSTDFPTASAFEGDQPGTDAFVLKIPKNCGPALLYSTYLGGGGTEVGTGVAVDSSQRACVVGFTESIDFPLARPFQGNLPGTDVFAAKLFANGGAALVYSTYVGGSGVEQAAAITIDSKDRACITGFTDSPDFPVVQALQTDRPGTDAFVLKIPKNGGATLLFSTYLGGGGTDRGFGIAVDLNDRMYITGFTDSTDFPLSPSPFQTDRPGLDAFVTKLSG